MKHIFKTDFMIFDEIIIEVKFGENGIIEKSIPQNFKLFESLGRPVGIIVNLGKNMLEDKPMFV